MALAGYPVGLTIAPIMPVEHWREQYRELLRNAAAAVADIPGVDLTLEMITHRFTAKSKLVQLSWYPKTTLSLEESLRTKKMTKFGSPKYVYPKGVAHELRSWFESAIAEQLPLARILYWT
jgi:spore photoproduct lyase